MEKSNIDGEGGEGGAGGGRSDILSRFSLLFSLSTSSHLFQPNLTLTPIPDMSSRTSLYVVSRGRSNTAMV